LTASSSVNLTSKFLRATEMFSEGAKQSREQNLKLMAQGLTKVLATKIKLRKVSIF